jgi:hypothetical protein
VRNPVARGRLPLFQEDEMLQRVREGVVASYPFATALVRGTWSVSEQFSESRPGCCQVRARWRLSFGRAFRRIARGLRICLSSARAPTTSSLRREADPAQSDATPSRRPTGSYLRRME